MKDKSNGKKEAYNGLEKRVITRLSTEQMSRVVGGDGGSPDTNVRTTSTVCFETEGKKEKTMGQESAMCD